MSAEPFDIEMARGDLEAAWRLLKRIEKPERTPGPWTVFKRAEELHELAGHLFRLAYQLQKETE